MQVEEVERERQTADEGEDGEGDEHRAGRAASVGVEALRSPLPPRLDISPTARLVR